MWQLALADLPSNWDEIIENIVTEDDEPVDIFSSKQMRLLIAPLYSSWKPIAEDEPALRRKFLAATNVGVFPTVHEPPLVPALFLSFDVVLQADNRRKENRAYFGWKLGKMPEVVVEIVTDENCGELDGKMRRYEKIAVSYCVVFDPFHEFSGDTLRVYELKSGGRSYCLREDFCLPEVGLSLTLWQGEFERLEFEWLRWCNADGSIIQTGEELNQNLQRAEQAKERAEKLAAKLRELGVDPEDI